MGLFQEYMDAKGKVVKSVVDISGGDPSPKTPPTKPPKEHGDKPYAASDGKSTKSEKGFGDQGDASLKYEPSDDPSSKGHPPAKIPTVEQVELSNIVAEAATRDQTLIENLVRQLKANGLLGPLVAEMLQHRESYGYISELMGHEEYGDETCRNLARAMSEEVAPPFSDQLEIADEDQDQLNGDTTDNQGIDDSVAPPADNFEDLEVGFEDEQPPVEDPLMQMQQMNPAMKNFQRALMGKFMDADNNKADVHQRMAYARHCKKMKKMMAVQ